MDSDATLKPQAGVDIAGSIGNIVDLQKYLDTTSAHRLFENFSDLEYEEC